MLLLSSDELSSSPARLEVRAGEGRGVATAPAAAPATGFLPQFCWSLPARLIRLGAPGGGSIYTLLSLPPVLDHCLVTSVCPCTYSLVLPSSSVIIPVCCLPGPSCIYLSFQPCNLHSCGSSPACPAPCTLHPAQQHCLHPASFSSRPGSSFTIGSLCCTLFVIKRLLGGSRPHCWFLCCGYWVLHHKGPDSLTILILFMAR